MNPLFIYITILFTFCFFLKIYAAPKRWKLIGCYLLQLLVAILLAILFALFINPPVF